MNHIQIWRTQGKLVYDALELCRTVQDQKKRKAAQDVQARIEEMKHAKDEMVRVFNLARQLAVFMAVPFVSDYISMNACIFVELGNLCDKIADYAMQIVKETENAADLFHRANNSHHSILNYDRQIIIEYNRNTNR